MSVAIRELKAGLSQILSRAQAGEAIEVTSHNRPIARIVGIPTGTGAGLRALLADGALTWNGRKPEFHPPGTESPRHAGQPDGAGGQALILFCDTSALVKLYLKEEHSDNMLAIAKSVSAIAVCRVAWAEMMAA